MLFSSGQFLVVNFLVVAYYESPFFKLGSFCPEAILFLTKENSLCFIVIDYTKKGVENGR